MRNPEFDDARLDHPDVMEDAQLRTLAESGARIRRACLLEPVGTLERMDRPRGVLVLGAEARLVRAVLEPICPVPFLAWPGPALPAWVGPLDLVVVMGGRDAPEWEVACTYEAARRGATLIVAAPESSPLAVAGSSHATTRIPVSGADPMAAAVAVLELLGRLELGPQVNPEHVADAADLVAEACSPIRNLAENPSKDLAIGLAEAVPLVWGGTTLAMRASRRIAEALRRASGRPALAADADELETLLRAVTPRDPFSDPDESGTDVTPVLLMLDDDKVPDRLAEVPRQLARLAEAMGVRVCRISSGERALGGSDVESYVTLLQYGRYAAAYLRLGLTT
ncbi:MAG: SIS domain-containing protein [Propionibacteriaceae bacterium]|nr:SIS domain-containing protein [Propionibacteriaceae bacterium]